MEEIVIISNRTQDKWINRHMDEINQAFGKDMSNQYLLVYNSEEDAKRDRMEHLLDCKWCCHKVKNKWVLRLT